MDLAAIWRIESPRLIAGLTRLVRDVSIAEELAQDALVAAMEQWPKQGTPKNPGAWLMQAAKHRALDSLRRGKLHDRSSEEITHTTDQAVSLDVDDQLDDDIGDDLLKLIFVSCHPLLSKEGQVALTLRLVAGLTTPEIARAFLQPETTIQQRIVRAKKTLSEAKVPFEVPHGEARHERLEGVLGVIYLIFNEGYAATSGDDWLRPELCNDALRLGRVLAGLMPDESEVHGLVALMELHASRSRARVQKDGTPILLLEQNRATWDWAAIERGLAALQRADERGPYVLQANIAACHGRARIAADTDWARIASLYDELAELTPSPIVELNRAVAVSMAEGPAAGLELVDQLVAEGSLQSYHLLPSVRGDLLEKLGRVEEARAEFLRASQLTQNERERQVLLARAGAR
ncbi:MAG: RNA polymerase sigma factor [Archangium sp.]